MIDISVTFDVKKVTRQLNRIERKQIPFAVSQALNKTAFIARKELMKQIQTKLDRPIPFTVKAFQVKKSTKNRLIAEVFIEQKRWKYLKSQIEGGRVGAKKKFVAVPFAKNIKLNKFGNIPGRRKGLIKKPQKQFIGVIKGVRGVWERTGGKRKKGVKLLVAFEKSVSYKKRFPFFKIVQGVVKNVFPREFNIAMRRALATAR